MVLDRGSVRTGSSYTKIPVLLVTQVGEGCMPLTTVYEAPRVSWCAWHGQRDDGLDVRDKYILTNIYIFCFVHAAH